ncbi:hypothetical protein ABIE37_004445 [Arthrobacter bambusae]|uniref:Transcriptional regulator, AbiEi antitoxin, Type IV TA system n=1 Tax=Arthrobacter bambusae TaxID=1338426 RepID=A0ABV2PCW6_9MICC
MDVPPGLIETPAILRARGRTDAIHSSFMAGTLVRIRRGYYVETSRWLAAQPWIRFAWTVAAAARAIPGLVLCRETAAFAMGIPILRTPSYVECVAPNPSRAGRRRPTLSMVSAGNDSQQVLRDRGFPLRYHVNPEVAPERVGEFMGTGLLNTALDVAFSSTLSQSLVVADGVARKLWKMGRMAQESNLLDVDRVAAAIQAHPHASARRRAELALSLASPLTESPGESFSRAAFQFLGIEQPELQHDFSDIDGFIGRSDFWWRGMDGRKGVVGEFDGKAKYTTPELRNGATIEEAVYNEKLREDRIRALGFGFARWGWADVENPERLRRKLIGAGLLPGIRTGLLSAGRG